MTSPFFRFESDFVDSLRCIPMAVRMRLDVSGVKLRLNEWSKLSQDQRLTLVEQPFETDADILAFRNALITLIASICGVAPSLLSELPDPIWENPDAVPAQIQQQARNAGIEFPLAKWGNLQPIQRFALAKLSRPGHENRNFIPAMIEFGLLPPGT